MALTTQQMLDDALAARHAIMIGKKAVSIRNGERSVTYSQANLADLDAYIAELRAAIAGTSRKLARNRMSYIQPL